MRPVAQHRLLTGGSLAAVVLGSTLLPLVPAHAEDLCAASCLRVVEDSSGADRPDRTGKPTKREKPPKPQKPTDRDSSTPVSVGEASAAEAAAERAAAQQAAAERAAAQQAAAERAAAQQAAAERAAAQQAAAQQAAAQQAADRAAAQQAAAQQAAERAAAEQAAAERAAAERAAAERAAAERAAAERAAAEGAAADGAQQPAADRAADGPGPASAPTVPRSAAPGPAPLSGSEPRPATVELPARERPDRSTPVGAAVEEGSAPREETVGRTTPRAGSTESRKPSSARVGRVEEDVRAAAVARVQTAQRRVVEARRAVQAARTDEQRVDARTRLSAAVKQSQQAQAELRRLPVGGAAAGPADASPVLVEGRSSFQRVVTSPLLYVLIGASAGLLVGAVLFATRSARREPGR